VIALFNAFVYVREVGAESRDWVQNSCTIPVTVSCLSLELCLKDFFGGISAHRYGPSKALIVSASRSSTACL